MGLDFCAIDFETANLDRGSPCAVGLVKVMDGRVVQSERWLMRPPPENDDFHPFNVALHGIGPADVRDQPRFAERLPGILAFAGGLPFVAHNAAFDMGCMRDACDWSEISWPEASYACTLVLARRTWRELLSYSLPWVVDAAGLSLDSHHDPEADARAAANVMLAIARHHEATSLEEVLDSACCRMGHISSAYDWKGCAGKYASGAGPELPDVNPDADPDHPFYGLEIVFTGALGSMTRGEAWGMVAEAGGSPAKGVTKNTNVLVMGYQDARKLAPGSTLSRKAQKAADLRTHGQDIEIMPELDFLQQLGDRVVTTEPLRRGKVSGQRLAPKRLSGSLEIAFSVEDMSGSVEDMVSDVEVSEAPRGIRITGPSWPGQEREPMDPPPSRLTDSTHPPPLPRLARPAPVPLDRREYSSTVCPYCEVALERLPRAKTLCRSCGQPIHVRSGYDEKRHLLRAIDQEAFAEEQQKMLDHWDREEEEALKAAGFLYGEWDVKVVGESYHQSVIADLAAMGSEHAALLIREPDNPHDPHAVRVDISGRTVGHLSRDSAQDVELMLEHLQRIGRPAWVRARITGGGGPQYGVAVDGMPDDEEWEAWE
jgi:DNA polymerase III epsilon subunit-like protein